MPKRADEGGSGGDAPGFKSFGDLRRALSGEEPPAEPALVEGEVRGLGEPPATPGAAAEADGADDGPDGARTRIVRRPAGFGPMETGPPPYRDEHSEEMALLASFRVRTVFPADVERETRALPRDPRPEDWAGRLDLRGETVFTIDGEDAKDYDDAISIAERADGTVELGVHIADVGHYVRPGTALDDEALARGTSVYLSDQVVPMLPEGLSNHLCSLVPHRDRLAYSVLMTFDAAGHRTDARVVKTVIKSAQRNTYRGVQELLDREDSERAREIGFLEEPLRALERWTKTQQAIRDAKGSLRMQSVEKKFLFDEDHEVRAIVDAPRYFSMGMIEETALAANQAVGDLFRSRGLPTIYRVHPEKDPEEIEAVARSLEEFGIRVPQKDRLTGRDIGRMIRAARRQANAEALIARIMGLIERAVYEVKDHVDVAKHFGLAREAYLHFTSPIRRYPDLMVHRWLSALEDRAGEAERELATDELLADLNDVAAHCSMQADVADMAESANKDLKVCQFMEPHIGEKIAARVVRVSRAGLEVHLADFNVTGFVPARSIGDKVEVKGSTILIRSGRQARSFSEGHPIGVVVKDVDFLRLQVLLELA